MNDTPKRSPRSFKKTLLMYFLVVVPPALLVIVMWLYAYRDLIFGR